MTQARFFVGLALVGVLVAAIALWAGPWRSNPEERDPVVINEAARTLLYLPLYHAESRGYFDDEGVEVEIVTGGTATASVAALISGEADIAQADPMYAPISREGGSDIVVLGQIVGRIGLWALARDGRSGAFNADALSGATVVTHPQPMTAYTYTTLYLNSLSLDRAAEVIQARPGTEVAAFTNNRSAAFFVGVEPAISILEQSGGRIVYSWAESLGDRPFSGLMVREETLDVRADQMAAVLRAYERALRDISRNDPRVLDTASAHFPGISRTVLQRAIRRLIDERVFPQSLLITQEAWEAAVLARREAGDLDRSAPYGENVAHDFTETALRSLDE